jgi:hypothetical protein
MTRMRGSIYLGMEQRGSRTRGNRIYLEKSEKNGNGRRDWPSGSLTKDYENALARAGREGEDHQRYYHDRIRAEWHRTPAGTHHLLTWKSQETDYLKRNKIEAEAAEEQVRVKQELADDSDDDSVIIISETTNAQSPQRPLRTRPRRNPPPVAPNSFDRHQHPSDALAFSSPERRLGGADPVIASMTSDVLQPEKSQLPTPALSSTFRFPSPTSFIDDAIFGWKC